MMQNLSLEKQALRKFGMTMGIAFGMITLFILLKGRYSVLPTSIIAAVFFGLTVALPQLLRPIYILWMRLAFVLGWVNTRLILFLLFYLIFTPIGVAFKLCGVDLLDRKINRSKDSYWIKKEKKEFNPLNYERQF